MELTVQKRVLNVFDCHSLAENVWQAIHTDSPNFLNYENLDPKTEHPIFYGCYDWHSAVHSHCTIILLSDMMNIQNGEGETTSEFHDRLVNYFEQSFSSENVGKELQSIQRRPDSWECPYGFVWFLKLFLVCQQHVAFQRFGKNLSPLLHEIVRRLIIWIQHEFHDNQWPYRRGWHENTAFGLKMIHEVIGQLDLTELHEELQLDLQNLQHLVPQVTKKLYANDKQIKDVQEKCPFLSPSLCEANAMSNCSALDTDEEILHWLHTAIAKEVWDMPPNNEGDPQDGYKSHLCGLNFSRAYDFACIAQRLDLIAKNETTHDVSAVVLLKEKLITSAVNHYNQSVSTLASGHFMGDHWLASFAVRAKMQIEVLLPRK